MNQPLGGEADPNRWFFARHGEEGPLPNPSGHTFPLLAHDETGKWSLVGTRFYVSDNGLFVTARHVIEHVCRDGKQVVPLVILHLHSDVGLFGPSECLFRPIMQCWLGATEDIAFGVAATATNSKTGQELRNWTWTLSWQTPPIGAQIRCLKDAFIEDVVPLDGGPPRRMSFDELVRTGPISVANYLPRDADAPLSGSVLRLDMPATAKRPEVEVSLYA